MGPKVATAVCKFASVPAPIDLYPVIVVPKPFVLLNLHELATALYYF